jgi:elongation factor 1-alpha
MEDLRSDKKKELCIITAGSVDSGKSTLMSVLVYGNLDDGNGSARDKIAKHPHEKYTGRTSDISQRVLKVNDKKEITFVDLCGHEKYLKTTMYGMHGYFPDYAILVIAANRGILKMTREHLGLLLYMDIPIIITITREDIAPQTEYERTVNSIKRILKNFNKKVIFLNRKNNGQTYDLNVENDKVKKIANEMSINHNITSVITISSKTGYYVDILRTLVSELNPRKDDWIKDHESGSFVGSVFYIDSTFSVKGVGLVLTGILKGDTINIDDEVLIGPYNSDFVKAIVRSIHNNTQEDIKYLENTQRGCLAVRIIDKKVDFKRGQIKKGCLVVSSLKQLKNIGYEFSADIQILHHSTTISGRFCSVIHCGVIKQTARIILDGEQVLKNGDKASVKFRFLQRPEFIEVGTQFKFREGSTKGTGIITDMLPIENDIKGAEPQKKFRKHKEKRVKF